MFLRVLWGAKTPKILDPGNAARWRTYVNKIKTKKKGSWTWKKRKDLLIGFQEPVRLGLVVLPADFYGQRMGFFCKKEWGFEKTTHIPLRFRLGSLENCNWLEGKK